MTWLTRPALERFLHRHQKPRDGILQRFAHPHQVYNHCIRSEWSPNLHSVQLCRNINHWTDKSKDLSARMSTFEAPSHLTIKSSVSKVRARQVKKATMSLVRHVNALLPSGYSCWNAVVSFKINPDGNLLFLSCSSMQIRNTAQKSSGFVPRSCNYPDERPTIS